MAGSGQQGSRPGKARGNGYHVGRGQHFLLSAKARTLSIAQVARLTEDEAHALFEAIRWCDSGGDPTCAKCGCCVAYRHKTRPIFTCKGCGAQFSVTTGTVFHARKLAVRDILTGIAIFANGAKGHSALQLGRDLDVSYKTAFVLSHKIREAIGRETLEREASGTVEVDGAYFGGYVKPKNRREDRKDRRKWPNKSPKRRVVVIMRERGGRTLPFVVRFEHHAGPTLEARIRPGSTVHADEARSWDSLQYAGLDLRRINHEEAYSSDDGCTNMAESFFSRLRRAEIGMHHHVAGPYLGAYANEMAWREDARRIDNGSQVLLMSLAALTTGPSALRGYWQRHKRRPASAGPVSPIPQLPSPPSPS